MSWFEKVVNDKGRWFDALQLRNQIETDAFELRVCLETRDADGEVIIIIELEVHVRWWVFHEVAFVLNVVCSSEWTCYTSTQANQSIIPLVRRGSASSRCPRLRVLCLEGGLPMVELLCDETPTHPEFESRTVEKDTNRERWRWQDASLREIRWNLNLSVGLRCTFGFLLLCNEFVLFVLDDSLNAGCDAREECWGFELIWFDLILSN